MSSGASESAAPAAPEPGQRPDLWPWSARRAASGELAVAGIGAPELAREFGTPAFVMDRADFRGRAEVWATAMAEEFWDGYGLAGGAAYYAGKAFLCADAVRQASGAGLGIDTASLGELTLALRAGADPAHVGLHGNNKSDAELRLALTAGGRGIGRIIADSLPELRRIEALAGELGIRAPVMVRLKTGVHAGGHEFVATDHEDQKFGLSIHDGGALAALHLVAGSPHLRLVGLHDHIGSQVYALDAFRAAVRLVLEFRDRAQRHLGVAVPEVDLGGGYPVAYSGADPRPPSIRDCAVALADAVRVQCERLSCDVPRVSVEPGRSIAGPSTLTLYTVGTIKDVTLPGGSRRYVSVDGGMSDNIRPALYGARYTALLANRASSAPPVDCRVVGKHCESGDVLISSVGLPGDLRAGDLLAVPVTGAYGYAMASNYNLTPRPGVLGVEGGRARWLVRPEAVDDLLARDALL